MRKIRLIADIGYAGCGDEEIIEVSDDTSEKALNTMAHDFGQEHAASWEGDERLGINWDDEEEVGLYWDNVEGWWEACDEDC